LHAINFKSVKIIFGAKIGIFYGLKNDLYQEAKELF
jgi:hypothetical protein